MAQGSGFRDSEMKVLSCTGPAIAENQMENWQMKRKRGGPSMDYIYVFPLLTVTFKRVGCGVV